MQIIDGKYWSKVLNECTHNVVDLMQKQGMREPLLQVILVGDDYASQKYVASKERLASKLGIKTKTSLYSEKIDKYVLEDDITFLNNDKNTDAILMQLPLPGVLKDREQSLVNLIDVSKDVDGLSAKSQGLLLQNSGEFYPQACTPKGIISLLKLNNIDIKSKNVVIVGRSLLVGKPLSLMFTNENATVTLCNSYTKNLKQLIKNADIFVSAIGKPNFFDITYFHDNMTIIDIGINHDKNGKLVGDIQNDVINSNLKSYITPVPGGVGPMTVSSLMWQTVELSIKNQTDDEIIFNSILRQAQVNVLKNL